MKKYLLYILSVGILFSCTQKKPLPELNDPQSLLQVSQHSYEVAANSHDRAEILQNAQRGIEAAKRCSEIDQLYAACHFYYALNTGVYYETRLLGYPTGIQQIHEKAQTVIDIDPHYEHAGGYRLLGKLYMEVPSREVFGEHITRDLNKACYYLGLAVQEAPDYPANQLYLAECLTAKEEFSHAQRHLAEAKNLIEQNPRQFKYSERKEWMNDIKKLEQNINKSIKEK